MKNFNFLFSIFFVLLTYAASGQVIGTSPPPLDDFHTWVKHKEIETTYYLVDAATEVTDLDKAQLKATKDIKQFSKFYSSTTKMPITIIDRVETENIYEDWMTQPAKFVLNDYGIACYNQSGGLIKEIPHSPAYQQYMNQLSSGVFLQMQEITQAQINTLSASGINAVLTSDGSVVISNNGKSLALNFANRIKSITNFDGDGNAISTITTKYIPVTDINPNHPEVHDVIPVFEKEIRKVNLPSGACAELVRIVQREEYAIAYGGEGRERSEKMEDLETVKWYPNPVIDALTIENSNDDNILISIYNLQGQKVKEIQAGTSISLNIEDLPNGVFILSIKSKNDESISKFIKL